jgi:carbon storage regulator
VLVLTRKPHQSIMIGDDIEVKVLAVLGDKVKLGIRAPRHVPVYRDEIYLELAQQDRARAGSLRADIDEALRRLGDKP